MCTTAHTFEWDGTAWYAGDIYVGSTGGIERDDGSQKLCTVEEAEALAGADAVNAEIAGAYATQEWVKTYMSEAYPDLSEASY